MGRRFGWFGASKTAIYSQASTGLIFEAPLDPSNAKLPIILSWRGGGVPGLKILGDGNVGIGISIPTEKLAVNGNIRSKEIKVEAVNWPDYVFNQDYKILGLDKLEAYIKANKHLPEMPSSKDVELNGIALGEMNKLLLKKIEELTLLLIQMKKENETDKINTDKAILALTNKISKK